MNSFEWLAEPATNTKTNLQRLAELIFVNGKSMVVTKVNDVAADESKYKRVGLTFGESLELTFMRGCLEGLIKAHGPEHYQELMAAVRDLLFQEMEGSNVIVASSLETRVFGRPVLNNLRKL